MSRCRLQFDEGEITRYVIWHARLNQIMVGMDNGTVHILYDPDKSHFGATFIEQTYVGRSLIQMERSVNE